MAQDLCGLIEKVRSLTYAEKLYGARELLGRCISILGGYIPAEDAVPATAGFVAAAVAADGSMTDAEEEMLAAVFGDFDCSAALAHVGQGAYAAADRLVDSLPGEEKSVFCLLAIYVLSADDRFDEKEIGYLRQLID